MQKYFYKPEYKFMYLSVFFYSFANALSETFGTVMLYKAGVPIYIILLIYGTRFLITGLITPSFVSISSKIGIAKCILLSNVFSIVNSYFMLNGEQVYRNIVVFMLAMGLMGLSNPSSDALSSRYVDTEHRGRFNSFYYISKILGTVFASCLVAWGVISDNTYVLFGIIVLFFLLQYVAVRRIDYKPESKTNAFGASIQYILKSKSKYKVIYALRTNHIIERLFVPLYLYIALQDFAAFSTVIVVSLLFQTVTITLVGKYADKNLNRSNNIVSVIKGAITAVFLLAKNKWLVSTNKALADNFDKVYETSIQTSIQNIIRSADEDHELLSAVGQMVLCFTEVIVFAILAVIAKFAGMWVFGVIFVMSIMSTIFVNIDIKRENKKLG